jgi:hypothetical protein
MIAQYHKVCVFEIAVLLDHIQQDAELAVVDFQLLFYESIVNAVRMPHRVEIAHFYQHHIWLAVVTQDVGGQRHRVSVQAPVFSD